MTKFRDIAGIKVFVWSLKKRVKQVLGFLFSFKIRKSVLYQIYKLLSINSAKGQKCIKG